MNLDLLKTKLIAAARNVSPPDDVPYAFEQRVMARLRARPEADSWAVWAQGLWRGALACLLVSAGAAYFALQNIHRIENAPTLSEELEQTLLISVEDTEASW